MRGGRFGLRFTSKKVMFSSVKGKSAADEIPTSSLNLIPCIKGVFNCLYFILHLIGYRRFFIKTLCTFFDLNKI